MVVLATHARINPMTLPLSFFRFSQRTPAVVRLPWMEIALFLAMVAVAVVFWRVSQAQSALAQAIAQETVTSQQVEMGMAAIRFMLASTFAGAVALFLVGAFVAIALRKRMETAYRKYLSTIPVPDLARFARGLETDAESREHAIATLTARQPGWSYQ